jgi:secreted trypsin-like serine protease
MFQGDTGNALVIRDANGWTQIGIGSFMAPAGCARGSPSGHTRVSEFRDWIRSETGI